MQFNSVVFVFFFLPLVILGSCLLKKCRFYKLWLLAASLVFYGWCSTRNLLFLLLCGLLNYCMLTLIHKHRSKVILAVTIVLDVAVLVTFKYLGFLTSTCNILFGTEWMAPDLIFPLGVSFLTFSAISYAVDVYRQPAGSTINLPAYFFYISFFPKVVQGPIARPADMTYAPDRAAFYAGLRRFVIGLAKKCLIADVLGRSVDLVCSNLSGGISVGTAWMGILFYTFQIYFDFSGYTDMAIGIGNILGFSLPENFRAPYLSRSISDFWRRWHMTLGSWFRDYVYIPLGGNRGGTSRTLRNLAVVWLLTGIWHGASFNFILWGCYHGTLVILEKLIAQKRWYLSIPSGVKWAVTFILVMVGWVVFRTADLTSAAIYLRTMFGGGQGNALLYGFWFYFDAPGFLALGMAILTTMPRPRFVAEFTKQNSAAYILMNVGIVLLFLIAVIYMINSTYNAFIYFQF